MMVNWNEIEKIPVGYGVYKFYDNRGNLLYIGKSNNLRKRVKNYNNFVAPENPSGRDKRMQKMIPNIYSIEIISCYSEVHALFLENKLIKEEKPEYNKALSTYLNYASIEILDYSFPVMKMSSKSRFGYFKNKYIVENIINLLNREFGLRYCIEKLPINKCSQNVLNNCSAPCRNLISPQEYNSKIQFIVDFLRGSNDNLIFELQKKMQNYSNNFEFEKALEIKTLIHQLNNFFQKAKIYQKYKGKIFIIQDGKYYHLIKNFDYVKTTKSFPKYKKMTYLCNEFLKFYKWDLISYITSFLQKNKITILN